MRPSLQVTISATAGVPCVQVPHDDMWELVEYISWQRVLAHYDYAETHFTVTFPHLDTAAAQRLIDEWNTAQSHPEPTHATIEVHAAHHPVLSLHHLA